MNCSVKFLSPIVTTGLPVPGSASALRAVVERVAAVAWSRLPPQALRPAATAITATDAITRNSLLQGISGIADARGCDRGFHRSSRSKACRAPRVRMRCLLELVLERRERLIP